MRSIVFECDVALLDAALVCCDEQVVSLRKLQRKNPFLAPGYEVLVRRLQEFVAVGREAIKESK